MDKETIEEQVREMIWALHPSLTGEDLASYDFGFGSVVELISMATHKACVEEREANGWQLIESAPKDGTAILGYQKINDDLWVIVPMYRKDVAWLLVAFHGDNTEHEMHPTKWKPIPDPPKDEVSE